MALRMTAEEYKNTYGEGTQKAIADTPARTVASAERGIIESTLKRPLERLVLEPARRFGETVGSAILSPFVNEKQAQRMSKQTEADKSFNVPLLGEFKTRGVKPGMEGAKQIAGEALETGTYLAPTGRLAKAIGGTKGAVAAGAATGYGFDVGSDLQQNKSLAEAATPGLGTAIGAALPLIGGIIGNFPKKMEAANLRMTPVEKQNLAKQGKDIVDYMARKKIVGTPEMRYAKVDKLYDKMEDAVSGIVKNSGQSYKKADLLAELDGLPAQFADDPAGFKEAENAVNRIKDFIVKNSPEDIPASLIQTYKRNVFKRAYSKNNTDVVNEAYHAVASLFKGKLDSTIPQLNSLNKEYGNLLTARKVLFKAISRPQTGLTSKIAGTVAGTALGGSLGGFTGAGVGALVGEQVASKMPATAIRSASGATVQALQDVLSRIPIDKSGNLQITQKGLITLLQDYLGE